MGKITRLDRTVQRLQAKLVDANAEIERLRIALESWCESFKNTIGVQEYEVNVFDLLNARYIETRNMLGRPTGLEQKIKGG